MENDKKHWTRTELKIYILLLCSNADRNEGQEEISLIKSKVDKDTFEKIYREFSNDTKEQRLGKIRENVAGQNYSHMELYELRREIQEVFLADKKFELMEQKLEMVLENILY